MDKRRYRVVLTNGTKWCVNADSAWNASCEAIRTCPDLRLCGVYIERCELIAWRG